MENKKGRILNRILRWQFAAIGVLILLLVVLVVQAHSEIKPPPGVQKVRQVQLTEGQCQELLAIAWKFAYSEPFEPTPLARAVMEQYMLAAGRPVVVDNPNVMYVLPTSQCGEDLDQMYKLIAEKG